MKKVLVFLVSVLLVLTFSACDIMEESKDITSNVSENLSDMQNSVQDNASSNSSWQDEAKITSDEALDIALKRAGLSKEKIHDLENELDMENGKLVYEIDFDSGNEEYSFNVDAKTGDISEAKRERDN